MAETYLSSDSDDEDYVPPAQRSKGAGSSAAPQPSGSDTDSAAADAFYAMDAVPEYADSDMDRPPPPRRAGGSSGAGPSSAGAGPSRAGSSAAGAGPSRAGGSSAAGSSAAAASSVGAASSAAAPAPGAPALPGTGSSSTGARAAASAPSAAADLTSANAPPGARALSESEKAKVLPTGQARATADVTPDAGAVSAGAGPAEAPKASPVNGNGAPKAASANQAVPIASPRNAVKEAKGKKSVDDLWREMNKPIAKSSKTDNAAKSNSAVDAGLGDWLKKPAVPKTKVTSLPRLDDVENKREAEDTDEIQPVKKQKLGTGLEAVLNAAKGEQKSNTLEKTKETWKEFKKDDKEVEEELEAYKKDKNRYTDKVSFLERTNKREWEVEQAGKKKR